MRSTRLASKRFYDAALGALGIPEGEVDELGRAVYAHDGGRFVIRTPLNGESASGANGGTLGFQAGSPEGSLSAMSVIGRWVTAITEASAGETS